MKQIQNKFLSIFTYKCKLWHTNLSNIHLLLITVCSLTPKRTVVKKANINPCHMITVFSSLIFPFHLWVLMLKGNYSTSVSILYCSYKIDFNAKGSHFKLQLSVQAISIHPYCLVCDNLMRWLKKNVPFHSIDWKCISDHYI